MTVTEAGSPGASLDIGGVVQDTLRILGSRAAGLAALTGIFVVVPQVIAGLVPIGSIGNLLGLLSLFSEGAAMVIAHGELSGTPVGARAAFEATSSRFGHFFLFRFLSGLSFVVGILLLVVPALVLMARWMAAGPAILVEKTTAREAMKRSAELTQGSRWALFWLALIYTASFLLALIPLVAIPLFLDPGGAAEGKSLLMDAVLVPLVIAVLSVVGAVGSGVVYARLRTLREGVPGGNVAAVFS